jgi:GT2 family glycosyltransferase
MRQTFWVAGDVVWWPRKSGAGREKVAVVTVSYNTRELTALLLWSLRTIVNWPDLEIVVVDNGSADGSAELLAEAAQAGICVLVANDVNRQHGPVSTKESLGWPPGAGRCRRGSGSWTPTSLPHGRTRCRQPWPVSVGETLG